MDAEAIRQGRAHDAAMTAGPWTCCHGTNAIDERPRIFLLTEEEAAGPLGDCYNAACTGLAENTDSLPDAKGIAWMRNNLRDLLDAAAERDRLQADVRRLSGLLADARWDLMP